MRTWRARLEAFDILQGSQRIILEIVGSNEDTENKARSHTQVDWYQLGGNQSQTGVSEIQYQNNGVKKWVNEA